MGITKRRLLQCLTAAAGIGAVATAGCQTRIGGVPYPTPHYLQHVPQYFPPDPPFPLQRERDSMLDPTGELRRGNPNAAAPALGAAPVGINEPVPGR
jgi:hypothetical protein